jgi:hypothetical protein
MPEAHVNLQFLHLHNSKLKNKIINEYHISNIFYYKLIVKLPIHILESESLIIYEKFG